MRVEFDGWWGVKTPGDCLIISCDCLIILCDWPLLFCDCSIISSKSRRGPGMPRRRSSLTERGALRPQVTALSYYVTGLSSSSMFCDCSFISSKSRRGPGMPRIGSSWMESRCKATWERKFKFPWRKAGPPNHHDDEVDSDQ